MGHIPELPIWHNRAMGMPDAQMQIGRDIQSLRAQSGLTQAELAALVDLDAPAISRVERGERRISADRLLSICRALGLEFYIGPPRPARDDALDDDRYPPPPVVELAAPGHVAERTATYGPSMETVTEPALATMLAALADEYEALNDAGRRSLAVRFWAMHPDLRERADARAGRRLARLAGG